MRITINSLLEKHQRVFKEAIQIACEPGLNPVRKFALESKALAV